MAVRVGICHGTFADRDAIGNDIKGMYDTFLRIGATPTVLCEHATPGVQDGIRVQILGGACQLQDFDLLIYHHSIYWKRGEELLTTVRCPIVFKYHNVTPPHFFESFSTSYAALCEKGFEQSRSLIQAFPRARWLADSEFNMLGLIGLGLDAKSCRIVPPFIYIGRILRRVHIADYSAAPYYGLFVGRIAPNKGHQQLLEVVARYVKRLSPHFLLRIVGSEDPALANYVRSINSRISANGLQEHVQILDNISDDELANLYLSSHVYLNFSEHEGFCVPLIEAQAAGLPVICAQSGAVPDTLGPQQVIASLPKTEEDFLFYAHLIHEVITNTAFRNHLVECGLQNVSKRFLQEVIEDCFLDALLEQMEALCASQS